MITRQLAGTAIGAGAMGLLAGLAIGAACWAGGPPAAESSEAEGPPIVREPGVPLERAAPDWTRVTRGTLSEFWWQGRTWKKAAEGPLYEDIDPLWRSLGAEVFSATVPETRVVIIYAESGHLRMVHRQDLFLDEWMTNGEEVFIEHLRDGAHLAQVSHWALGIPVGLALSYRTDGSIQSESVHLGGTSDRFGRWFFENGQRFNEWTSNWNSEASSREWNEDGTLKESKGEAPEVLIRALQHVLGPDSPLGKL